MHLVLSDFKRHAQEETATDAFVDVGFFPVAGEQLRGLGSVCQRLLVRGERQRVELNDWNPASVPTDIVHLLCELWGNRKRVQDEV